MRLTNYIKAYVFNDFNAAVKLAQKNPSPGNVKLLQKICSVKNTSDKLTQNVNYILYENQKAFLTGKSIDPTIAAKNMDKMVFNGCGKIISLNHPLKQDDYKILINNIIKPLNETPVKNTEGRIRTAAECVIDMACVIKKSNLQNDTKNIMLNEIKEIYLSATYSGKTLQLLMKYFSSIVPKKTPLMRELNEIVISLEKKFYLTKHNDNYYGRSFDSSLAENVVQNPSKEMQLNIALIKKKIISDLHSLNQGQQKTLLREIACFMQNDSAVWRSDIPEVKNFLYKKPTAASFMDMINTPDNKNNLLIMHLAVKYLVSSPGFKKLKEMASEQYSKVIVPQRNAFIGMNNKIKSNRAGIKLPYQMHSNDYHAGYAGVRPIDKYVSRMDSLTKHNQEALKSERAIGIGMSGSSNILNYLFVQMDEEFSDFNIEHARLFTAAFLTHSGGHSINEAYTVFGYKDKEDFQPVSYSTLLERSEYNRSVIDSAYDKLIDEAMRLNRIQ